MSNKYQQNAKRGAALLDAHVAGWADQIDLSTLDLMDGCHCVLGQIYRDYEYGLDVLEMSDEEATAYGFFYTPWNDGDALTRAWHQEIKQRQAE